MGQDRAGSDQGAPAGTVPLRVHVFTDALEDLFLKQIPAGSRHFMGVEFSFGMEIPQSGIDVLIVYNRASYTLRTHLPRERTVFLAAEPDVIHPFKPRYLAQYGLVLSISDREIATERIRTATCWYWFAGIDFSQPWTLAHFKGHDHFSRLAPGDKRDRISIVTSNKVFTEYHRKRVRFVEALARLIPDRVDLYGRGYNTVNDKADALLPDKYHLAIENAHGPDTWTEKLADPYLCWAFPFYAGCTNVEAYFPRDSFAYVDIDDPEAAALQMRDALERDLWTRARPALEEARRLVLDRYNIACLLVDLARRAATRPVPPGSAGPTWLWSERSFRPEPGTRGSAAEWALRNALLLVSPGLELKSHALRRRIEAIRSRRRERQRTRIEARNKAGDG